MAKIAPGAFLKTILAHKREECARRYAEFDPFAGLEGAPPTPSLIERLRAKPGIIAEIKRGSPSKGLFAPDLDAGEQARRYADGGAAGISVLTDETFFHGTIADLQRAAEAVDAPLLRKDFVICREQLAEARTHGAALALLIVAALSPAQLRELLAYAQSIGLEALVEVHDREELRIAVDAGASLIGVNSRNLTTFEVDRDLPVRLAAAIPAEAVAIAESGMTGPEDLARYAEVGYRGFLIGETLARSADPAATLQHLLGGLPS